MSSKREDSLRREVCGTLTEKGCCGTEVHCLRKREIWLVCEYKAMNEENFLSSWLREDVEGTEERRKEMDKEAREEERRSGKREVEMEKGETVVKRRCVNPFSSVFVEEIDPVDVGEISGVLGGGSGGLSVCGLQIRLGCLVCAGCLFFRGL